MNPEAAPTEAAPGTAAAPPAPAAPAAPAGATADAGAPPAKDAAPAAPAAPAAQAERETEVRVALHKRERELDQRESKAKLTEGERTELEALRGLKGRAKEDVIGVLAELGIDGETVFKAMKDGKAVDPAARKALEKAAALEKQLEEQKAAAAKAKEAADVHQVREGLGILGKQEGDRFELLIDEGPDGIEAWRESIHAFATQRGRAPTLDEVKKLGDLVEKAYRDNYDRKAATKYAKAKLTPAAPKTEEAKPPAAKTLTNSADGRPATSSGKPGRKLSPHEELEQNLRDAGISFAPTKAAEG